MGVVAVLDYGSGNLRSVVKALEHVARADHKILLTSDEKDLDNADRVVLPGQGAFNQLSQKLHDNSSLKQALQHQVIAKGKPYLGICLGMQILADTGNEHGVHSGLGWIKGVVNRIALNDRALKIPHMGWNNIAWQSGHAFARNLPNTDFYFAHSYALQLDDEKDRLGASDYGGVITSAVAKDNIFGIQAHPEKSGAAGLAFLRHFLHWKG